MDYSVTIFEQGIADDMNVSVDEFFSPSVFVERVVKDYYKKIGVDDSSLMDLELDELAAKIVEKINNELK